MLEYYKYWYDPIVNGVSNHFFANFLALIIDVTMIGLLATITYYIFRKIRLPLLGYLILGILLGGWLGLLSPALLKYTSNYFITFSLVVILLKAGFSIDKETLLKTKRYSILLGFLPNIVEGTVFSIMSHYLLHMPWIQTFMLGFIISSVSPAVVVPSLNKISEAKYGNDKGINVIGLAGSSLDDVVSLTIFSSLINLLLSNKINVLTIFLQPTGFVVGAIVGLIIGLLLAKFFIRMKQNKIQICIQLMLLIGIAFAFKQFESLLFSIFIPIIGAMLIISMGYMYYDKNKYAVLQMKTIIDKIWAVSSVFLFTIIGALMNLRYLKLAGGWPYLIILVSLSARLLVVYICTYSQFFNWKERLFMMIMYIPKATVQATLGSVPLANNIAYGDIILAVAVISILITAPLGLALIELTYKKLLSKDKPKNESVNNKDNSVVLAT